MIYTANEVFRTAHEYIYSTDSNPGSYGYGLKHGINQVCRCCKSADARKITNSVELKPWSDFYKKNEYAAYECLACGYMFSWYRDPEDSRNCRQQDEEISIEI